MVNKTGLRINYRLLITYFFQKLIIALYYFKSLPEIYILQWCLGISGIWHSMFWSTFDIFLKLHRSRYLLLFFQLWCLCWRLISSQVLFCKKLIEIPTTSYLIVWRLIVRLPCLVENSGPVPFLPLVQDVISDKFEYSQMSLFITKDSDSYFSRR